MKGCLALPFRLLALALAVLGAYVAWSHRDAIRRRIHAWTAPSSSRNAEQPAGQGNAALGPTVAAKLRALGSKGRDSVLLSAEDVASLIAAAAAERLPGALDSIAVRLQQDDIEVHARVDTRRVPLSFGPLSGVVRDREPVEAGGRLVFRQSGLAEWEVTRARVRGIPLPRNVLERLLQSFNGSRAIVPVPLPSPVGGLRVSERGLVLYPAVPAATPR
jgi:hypothetical protein